MSPILSKLGPYAKTVAALVVGIIGWASAVVASDSAPITATEWIMLATVAATAIGVYSVANSES